MHLPSLPHNPSGGFAPPFDNQKTQTYISNILGAPLTAAAAVPFGASHRHYLLRTTNGQFVAKIYPHQPFILSHPLARQQELYQFFHRRGVLTPPVIHRGRLANDDFFIMPYITGEGDGWVISQQLTKDQLLLPPADNSQPHFLSAWAEQLAIIHHSRADFCRQFITICYPADHDHWRERKQRDLNLQLTDAAPMPTAAERLARHLMQQLLDHPAIKPTTDSSAYHATSDFVPLHGDYRLGNVLVAGLGQEPRLTAILDWELAGFGLALEDIGWLSAPCWHYARPDLAQQPLADFWRLYSTARHTLQYKDEAAGSGKHHPFPTSAPLPAILPWFQSLAMLRWGLFAQKQWQRKQAGQDDLPALPQQAPDIMAIFTQGESLLSRLTTA